MKTPIVVAEAGEFARRVLEELGVNLLIVAGKDFLAVQCQDEVGRVGMAGLVNVVTGGAGPLALGRLAGRNNTGAQARIGGAQHSIEISQIAVRDGLVPDLASRC